MPKTLLGALALFLFLSAVTAQGQSFVQTLRGQVLDADTRRPLTGATIALPDAQLGTATDEAGYYRIENVPLGRHRVVANYIGYQTLDVQEVLVAAGKEAVLNLELREAPADLATVTVRANRADAGAYTPFVKTLSVEETLRFPATYFDPARLAMAFAGVAGDNDQANGISIRGNSPNGLSWRLEGVDIVNPNHTPNAGTFSDRTTQNGGGVNILSAQLLGNSDLYTGAFPVGYGNALSGVMDMRLRPGNNEEHEFTAQIGVIGLDIATEGPLSADTRASYLVNYRYSTVGLLTQLGVNLGDEAITFQDLAFHLVFPFRNGGELTLFGMGGTSENDFAGKRDSALWLTNKDRFDIRFASQMGAAGATLTTPVGKAGRWRNIVAFSGLQSSRRAARLADDLSLVPLEEDQNNQAKLSWHSKYQHKLSNRLRLSFGALLTQQYFTLLAARNSETIADGQVSGLLLQPYAGVQATLSNRLSFDGGLHATYFALNGSSAIEPRAAFSYRLSPRQTLSLAAGLHSQLQPPQLYFASLDGGADNRDLALSKAQHNSLAYRLETAPGTVFSGELFYQYLFDIPVSAAGATPFSAINLLEGFVDERLSNTGTGRNYGLELSLQKLLNRNFYYLANTTFYRSEYSGSDGVRRSTRFDGRYIANLTIGKEWGWLSRKEKNRLIGVNVRVAYLGGFRATPIDLAASAAAGRTVEDSSQPFAEQQPSYFRTDLRIYYKRNKTRYNSTLSLDLQNASNQQNVAFSFYDPQQKTIVQQYQLGLIPLLNYRIEF